MNALHALAYALALIGPYLLTLYVLDALFVPTWAAVLGASLAGSGSAVLLYC